ncbi:MAG: hypothetical protein KDD53_04295, partial [Bdellovibrionales bacterium]|nr:hypothetical protein [Bdellovibrionales bacterium]
MLGDLDNPQGPNLSPTRRDLLSLAGAALATLALSKFKIAEGSQEAPLLKIPGSALEYLLQDMPQLAEEARNQRLASLFSDQYRAQRISQAILSTIGQMAEWRKKIDDSPDSQKALVTNQAVTAMKNRICDDSVLYDSNELAKICKDARALDLQEAELQQNYHIFRDGLNATSLVVGLTAAPPVGASVAILTFVLTGMIDSHFERSAGKMYSAEDLDQIARQVGALDFLLIKNPENRALFERVMQEPEVLNYIGASTTPTPEELIKLIPESAREELDSIAQDLIKGDSDAAKEKLEDFAKRQLGVSANQITQAEKGEASESPSKPSPLSRLEQERTRNNILVTSGFINELGAYLKAPELQIMARASQSFLEISRLVDLTQRNLLSSGALAAGTAGVMLNLLNYTMSLSAGDAVMEGIKAIYDQLLEIRKELLLGFQRIDRQLVTIFEISLETLQQVIETKSLAQINFAELSRKMGLLHEDNFTIARQTGDERLTDQHNRFNVVFDRLDGDFSGEPSVYEASVVEYYGRATLDAYQLSYNGDPGKQIPGLQFAERVRGGKRAVYLTGLLPVAQSITSAKSSGQTDFENPTQLPNIEVWGQGAQLFLNARMLCPQMAGQTYTNMLQQLYR